MARRDRAACCRQHLAAVFLLWRCHHKPQVCCRGKLLGMGAGSPGITLVPLRPRVPRHRHPGAGGTVFPWFNRGQQSVVDAVTRGPDQE